MFVKELKNLSKEDQKKVLDAPIWISLHAAVSNDGEIDPAERSEAIKQAHFRTYTSPVDLHTYYKAVDENFADRFEEYSKTLPKDEEEAEKFISEKVEEITTILQHLDKDEFAEQLLKDLQEFYKYVFRSNSNVFQYFAFPLITNALNNRKS
jgi:hypothetical protein